MQQLSEFPVSPYHLYNLYRNPFGELTRNERAELAVVDIDHSVSIATDPGSVLQFVGDCGHGKTTHLLALLRRIANAQYVYLPEDGPRPRIPEYRPLLVDEAQRLSLWQLRRVLKLGGQLVFGTHVDLSRAIKRAGLEVVTLNVARNSSVEHLLEILHRRMDASQLGHESTPRISPAMAIRLREKHGSNVRAIEQELYEQFQQHALEQRQWPPADSL